MVYLPRKEYYEGILQLRGPYEDVLVWVMEKTEKDGRAAITKQKKVRGGIDLYYSSQKYLQTLSKKLKDHFGGVMKVSSTLHTHKKGDALYRLTVLFRILPFKPGDTFEYQGEEVEVLRIARKVHVKEIKTGKKKILDLDTVIRVVK